MYLVATKWRGAINIASMRVFPEYGDAINYAVNQCMDANDPMLESNFWFLWEMPHNQEPKLMRKAKCAIAELIEEAGLI